MSYVSPIKIGYAAEPEEGWTDKIGRYIAGEVDNLVLESCVEVGCHVDKDELEKALRYDRDQYEKGYDDGMRDAAAAIEELQAQLPKRGKWITIRLNNGGSYTGCSCCEAPIPTDTMLDYIPESESKYCYSCGARMEVQDG